MADEEKVKKSAEKENEFIEKALEEEDKLRKEKLKVRFEDEEEGPTKRRKGESDDRDEPEEKGQKREQEEGQGSEEQPRRRRRRGRQGVKRNAENEAEREEDRMIGNVQMKEVRDWKKIQALCPGPHEEGERCEDEWLDDWIVTEDSLTGKVLDQKMVENAKNEEVEFIEGMPVYEVVDDAESFAETGKGPIDAKWVSVNKGSDEEPFVRCRWVARDFKPKGDRDREDLFADMPPLEAKRLLLRMAKVDAYRRGVKRKIKGLIIDVRKAHLNGICEDKVYVRIPPESKLAKPGKCGRLNRWLYGMRPAAQAWQKDYTGKLESVGFQVGRASKVVFYHEEWQVRLVVHGDDFTFVGEQEDLNRVEALMKEWYDIKVRGYMSEDTEDCQELTLLNRVLRWDADAIEMEADPKHVKMILEKLDLEDAKSVISPMTKDPKEEDGGVPEDEENELNKEEATFVRRVGARCNYLAQDRTDIAYTVRGICQEMSTPKVRTLRRLKRLGRYLKGAPRTRMRYGQVKGATFLDVYTDSDWAGDRQTRKSVSGGMVCVAGAMIKSWSKTQSVVARSSGEAEFYALNRGITEALGIRALAKDMGYDFKIRIHVDSSAAKSMVSRSGLGKTRHIQVEYLWSQDVMKEKYIEVRKILGTENPADVCTKPLNKADMAYLLEKIGVYFV